MMYKFWCVLSILFLIDLSHGEVYTALADLEQLLETESFLIESLENYIQAQEQKLFLLRK